MRQFNHHDPDHYRFSRNSDTRRGYAIEDCGGQSRIADKIVVIGAAVILVLLMVAL